MYPGVFHVDREYIMDTENKTMMTLHWTRVSEFKSGVVARYMQIQPLAV